MHHWIKKQIKIIRFRGWSRWLLKHILNLSTLRYHFPPAHSVKTDRNHIFWLQCCQKVFWFDNACFRPFNPFDVTPTLTNFWWTKTFCKCENIVLNNVILMLSIQAIKLWSSSPEVPLGKQKVVTRVTTHPQVPRLITLCNPQAAWAMIWGPQQPAWCKGVAYNHTIPTIQKFWQNLL